MRQPSIDDLTAFLAIAEHRSFRRAAPALGVSPSALSHAMRTLEDRVGVRLLNRTTRTVALTESGARLVERLRPAMASIRDALGEAAEGGEVLRGRIGINTIEYGALLLLRSVVGSFSERHPQVSIEITVDHALVDLVCSGFDAGVRFQDQVPLEMVAVPIAPPAAMVAFASPAYLEGRPVPADPSDLMGHRCIRRRLGNGAILRWRFEHAGRAIVVDPPGFLTLDSPGTIITAALCGVGIGFAPSHHVDEHFGSGRLVQLLGGFCPRFPGHCFYYPAARHPTRAFAAFVEHLRAHLGSADARLT